jgi:hypothetical protein
MQEVTKINKKVEVALDSKWFLDRFNDVFPDKILNYHQQEKSSML